MDWGGRVLREYVGRCPIDEVEDDWVKANVLPKIEGIEESHKDLADLEVGFRSWFARRVESYVRNGIKPIILVDVGFPVDHAFLYGMFHSIRRTSPGIIELLSPYPLYDLAPILAGAGLDPDVDRARFSSELRSSAPMDPHHPLTDATMSALCLVRTIRMLEDRHDTVHPVR
jgi:hypothetical protein